MVLFDSLFQEIMREIEESINRKMQNLTLEEAIQFYELKRKTRPKDFEFLTLLLVQGKNNVSEVMITRILYLMGC